jgi:chloramphenicol 3-O-phosphotransferase
VIVWLNGAFGAGKTTTALRLPALVPGIFTGLRAAGLAVFHVLLDADEDMLRRRILGSDEAQEWRLAHLTGYRAARPWLTEAADLVVDTAMQPPDEVAKRIASALPGLAHG